MAASIQEKRPKVEFCTWASAWMLNNDENIIENRSTDLPNVVTLLRSLGYKMSSMDGVKEYFSPLKNGGNGCKIVITCTHSKQSCTLEQSFDECSCSVFSEGDSMRDAFWEVTATTPSSKNSSNVVESGSELVPTINKELSFVIGTVLSYLCGMIKDSGNFKYSENFGTPKGRRSSIRSSIGGIHDLANLSAELGNRYRSLDALTSKNDYAELPEPGSLAQIANAASGNLTTTISSPNIVLSVDESSNSDDKLQVKMPPPIPSKVFPLIKLASDNLIKAMALIEGGASPKTPTTPTNFEEKMKTAGKSIKKLICTSKNDSTSNLKYRSSPNLSRRVSGSSLSVNSGIPTTYTLKPKPPKKAAPTPSTKKITPDAKTTQIPKSESAIKKPSTNKYAYVRSTISRNCAVKKEEKETKKIENILHETDHFEEAVFKYNKNLEIILKELESLKIIKTTQYNETDKLFKELVERHLQIGAGLIRAKNTKEIPDKYLDNLLTNHEIRARSLRKLLVFHTKIRNAVTEKSENQEKDEESEKYRKACQVANLILVRLRENYIVFERNIELLRTHLEDEEIKQSESTVLSGNESSLDVENMFQIRVTPPIPSKIFPLIKLASDNFIKAMVLNEAYASPKTPTTLTSFEGKIKTVGKSIKKLMCTSKNASTSNRKYGSSPNLSRQLSSSSLLDSSDITAKTLKLSKKAAPTKSTKKVTSNAKTTQITKSGSGIKKTSNDK